MHPPFACDSIALLLIGLLIDCGGKFLCKTRCPNSAPHQSESEQLNPSPSTTYGVLDVSSQLENPSMRIVLKVTLETNPVIFEEQRNITNRTVP